VTTYILEEVQRAAAISYLRQKLGDGKTLARLLLESVDFATGAVAVLNAIAMSGSLITEFNCGHVPLSPESAQYIKILGQPYLAYPTSNSYEHLTEVIYWSMESPESICLMENMRASPNDPWLKRAKSRLAIYGPEVYHILTKSDRFKEKIEDTLREAESLPVFVGAVGRQPADRIVDDSAHVTISLEQLSAFAKSIRCLFVGAYDGEGYVLWGTTIATPRTTNC
jgi:hypothetical protein